MYDQPTGITGLVMKIPFINKREIAHIVLIFVIAVMFIVAWIFFLDSQQPDFDPIPNPPFEHRPPHITANMLHTGEIWDEVTL